MAPHHPLASSALRALFLLSAAALAEPAQEPARLSDLSLIPRASALTPDGYVGKWTDVLSSRLELPQPPEKEAPRKDLLVSASLELGLFTDSSATSGRKEAQDASTAEAQVQVRMVIDKGTRWQRIAAPGEVTYDRLSQTLLSQLDGLLQTCSDANRDGAITSDECGLSEDAVRAIRHTLSTRAYFFGITGLPAGEHTVTLQARISYGYTALNDSANANAWVGQGGLSVEEVHFVKGLAF